MNLRSLALAFITFFKFVFECLLICFVLLILYLYVLKLLLINKEARDSITEDSSSGLALDVPGQVE